MLLILLNGSLRKKVLGLAGVVSTPSAHSSSLFFYGREHALDCIDFFVQSREIRPGITAAIKEHSIWFGDASQPQGPFLENSSLLAR